MVSNDYTILRSKLSPAKLELLEKRLQLARVRSEQSESFPAQLIPQRPDKDTAPLSFAQQRLWFLDQLMPGSAMYNVPMALRLVGHLNVAALARTLSEIVRRHEALRTTFTAVDGEPVQIIHPPLPFDLTVTDFSSLDEAEREPQAQRARSEEARRPFDLAQGSMLRVSLLRLGTDEHIILFTLHHIVSDGWSMGIFVKEVVALYQAYLEGRVSPLPELNVQYADYAVWQREWLQGEVLAGQVDYWRKQLSGAPAMLELPTDKVRPTVQRHRGAHHSFSLPVELTRQLRELSQSESASLFMTLLAGWQLLLGRYSGQDDVVVGTPIANRHRAEVEPLIGFFVNTVALRTRLEAGLSFRALVGQVKETALEAYAHQDLPFEKLVEELQPERSLSHPPLFQVFFTLQNAPVGELKLPGLELQPMGHSGEERSHFDLAMSIGELNGELRCGLGYNTDLFAAATIERLAGHYERLLEAAVRSPERQISELEMLSEAERAELEGWSGSEREYEQRGLVAELFAARAAQQPAAEAVSDGETSLTYAELEGAANRLAHYLLGRGLQAEAKVGVLLERGVSAVITMLAIWKAGGVYLPLDREQPRERLEFMLRDAGVQLVVSTAAVSGWLAESVAGQQLEVINLDVEREQLAAELDSGVDVGVRGEQLAYVIYTSGSTGEPKGVAVEHDQLRNTLQGAQEIYQFSSEDVVPCLAPLTFDISLFEVWGPLLAGGRLVLVEARQALEGAAIEELLTEITFMHAVPGLMRHFASVAAQRPGSYPQLRGLFVGGDVVSPELVWQVGEVFPATQLTVGYGPTEATIMCASYRVGAGEKVEHQLVGRAMGNVRLRVLDRHAQEVPVGVVGEIYIGGAGVARGYLNRPELTAERFVNLEGERYYRSGDLGRWLAAGAIEFVGRADEQVKVRGYRIEVGEVEAALSSHERVKEAVVTARADGSGEKRLVAYFVGETEEQAPTVAELRAHLQQRLPEYMVPTVYVELAKIPLTALAKVDRQALPEPDDGVVVRDAEYLAPRTTTEEILAGLWGEVLGVARVGVADNFFELGGHSLLATQLMSRVREAFLVEVPLRQLFEQPTVGGLGLAVEEAVRRGTGVIAPPIVPVNRGEGTLPVSFAQQRLWFIDQMIPGNATYNMPTAVRLTGSLDLNALRQTLSEIVRRHEALRTTFSNVDGRPVQVIHPHRLVPVPLIDLLSLSAGEQQVESERLAAVDARQPFDLAGGPLLRVTLLRLGPEEHVVLLTMHHIISDGWSMSVFVKEVAAIYKASVDGLPSPLAELAVQYADYAVWQREWLQGEVLEEQVQYWREQLSGAPAVLELPTDRPRSAMQRHRGGRQSFALSPELSEELRKLGRKESVTLFMTLLTAWQLLLARYSGQDDVVVGSPVANRNRGETESLIGFFVNMLVLRARLSPEMTFRELLAQVRESCLSAYAHQDVPFEKLVEELQPERSLSNSPLFQVAFVLQGTQSGALELPGLKISQLAQGIEHAMLDLVLNMQDAGQVFRGSLIYDADLFNASTMLRMVTHFRTLIENIVAEPDRSLSGLSLMDPTEEHQLIEEWNETRRDYADHLSINQLFEQQVAATPDAVALVSDTGKVTYQELNQRANQLAHHLVSFGVRQELRWPSASNPRLR